MTKVERPKLDQRKAPSTMDVVGVSKSFGAIAALTEVHVDFRPGEIHALLGENGTGKSRLVRIMSGALAPDRGSLRLGGREVAFASPADAQAQGVAIVSQELGLYPDLSILDNI